MKVQPVTANCHSIFENREHICFGISPFNSYFSEERIQELAYWGKSEFKRMHFFVPDVPAAYTLEAIGYTPQKALAKAKKQAQYLHNKIHRCLKNLGLSDVQAVRHVLNWEILSQNEKYLEIYQNLLQRFHSPEEEEFRNQMIEGSRWVLEKKVPDTQSLSRDVLESAARYLLCELPLFMNTAPMVESETSLFCYHQSVSLIDQLFHGQLSIQASQSQGFLVLRFHDSDS